jgi:hypothetical protein
MTRTLLIAALSLPALALSACGGGKDNASAGADVTIETAASQPDLAKGPSSEGMTAIDAVTGDAAAMPEDSSGPTAYDLARHEQAAAPTAEKQAEEAPANDTEAAAPSEPETPAG